MPTSSITKDFYVKDQKAFEQLKQELDDHKNETIMKSPSLEEGRKLLEAFVFKKKEDDIQCGN